MTDLNLLTDFPAVGAKVRLFVGDDGVPESNLWVVGEVVNNQEWVDVVTPLGRYLTPYAYDIKPLMSGGVTP